MLITRLRKSMPHLAISAMAVATIALSGSPAHADPELWKLYNYYASWEACVDARIALENAHPHIWQSTCVQTPPSPAGLWYRGTL